MKLIKLLNCPVPGGESFQTKDGLSIIKSIDKTPKWGELLHVSMSRPDRYPSWNEIIEVKLHFFGDLKDSMMVIPKRTDYVNVHKNCFHLWECPESWDLI